MKTEPKTYINHYCTVELKEPKKLRHIQLSVSPPLDWTSVAYSRFIHLPTSMNDMTWHDQKTWTSRDLAHSFIQPDYWLTNQISLYFEIQTHQLRVQLWLISALLLRPPRGSYSPYGRTYIVIEMILNKSANNAGFPNSSVLQTESVTAHKSERSLLKPFDYTTVYNSSI